MEFAATAHIDLNALAHNFAVLREHAKGAGLIAVVKANAYGHGIVPIARALPDASILAVARVSEARALREAGIERPILLLEGVFDEHEAAEAQALACELVIHTEQQIELLRQHPPHDAAVWIKVNSGMNRLGFEPESFVSVAQRLDSIIGRNRLRLMSHFASADLAPDFQTESQLAALQPILSTWEGGVSLANSPATLSLQPASPDPRPTWIRSGISLYGIDPAPGLQLEVVRQLRPVMRLTARIISERELVAGDRVGYGGRYQVKKPMRIGVVAAGYGDGYPRMMPDGAPVLVNGQRTGLVGRVSMDMLAIDITEISDAGYGSLVELWGPSLPVTEVADALGTISYELLTRVSDRVVRRYGTDQVA